MNIEDLLREALADMSVEAEPPPPSRFLRSAPARPRRRWGVALVSAAVVAALVGGSTFLIEKLSAAGPEPADRTVVLPPKPAPPRPLKEIWPGAVHTLPLELQNGLEFAPQVFLDDRTLLVRTGEGPKPGFWAYDLRTGQARRHITFAAPAGTDHTSYVTMSAGQLLWFTVGPGGMLDIFTVPVGGGTARKVTSINQTMKYGDIDLMAVAGGKLYLSRRKGGVYTVPMSGGVLALMPGTDRLHLMQWPWAAYPQPPMARGYMPRGDVIVNVLTGERMGRFKDPDESASPWDCLLVWCVQASTNEARRRDGSGAHQMPGLSYDHAPVLDRFKTLTTRDDTVRVFLYDLATGDTADLGIREKAGTRQASSLLEQTSLHPYNAPVLFYRLNGRMVVVDLTAID
ncbi:hypothetical protein Acor_36980 [Acrocarpospora corrugata]|uniref:Uncharacterized protein n=1 Tax=Acrocarpospora corrugata TaxID=35763 RepID=A0A5M3VYX3_9ACTN|nr:hypothetical protein [Acrocarpospora corrugata]GES01634.1 hypothetical protein Acor_36980 [Acrocarpospora corrugata]